MSSGGSNLFSRMLSGCRALNPFVPPKYSNPLLLLREEWGLNSSPCRPSAIEKFLMAWVDGVIRETPLRELTHRFPLPSCNRVMIVLSGRPSLAVQGTNFRVRSSQRFRPAPVPIHILPWLPSSKQLIVLLLMLPGDSLWIK